MKIVKAENWIALQFTDEKERKKFGRFMLDIIADDRVVPLFFEDGASLKVVTGDYISSTFDDMNRRQLQAIREIAHDLYEGLSYPLDTLDCLKQSIEATPRLNDLNMPEKVLKVIWHHYQALEEKIGYWKKHRIPERMV